MTVQVAQTKKEEDMLGGILGRVGGEMLGDKLKGMVGGAFGGDKKPSGDIGADKKEAKGKIEEAKADTKSAAEKYPGGKAATGTMEKGEKAADKYMPDWSKPGEEDKSPLGRRISKLGGLKIGGFA